MNETDIPQYRRAAGMLRAAALLVAEADAVINSPAYAFETIRGDLEDHAADLDHDADVMSEAPDQD